MSETGLPIGKPHKRQEVSKGLRAIIAQLSVGDRLPPISEIGRYFSASTSTVVSVLDELESEGRVLRRHGAGCFVREHPDKPANPVSASTLMGPIALLSFPGMTSRWFTGMLDGIREALQNNGRSPLVLACYDEAERYRILRRHWENGEVVGFLQVGSLLNVLPPEDIPGVIIGEMGEKATLPQVSVDNFAAGRLVGKCLWDFGHRHVAYLYPEFMRVIAAPRSGGLISIWTEKEAENNVHVVSVNNMAVHESRGIAVMRPVLESLLSSPQPITAISTINDSLATTVIRTLEKLGKQVPDDISVVGFDDTEGLAALYRPALTTVRAPEAELGKLSARTLVDLIANKPVPRYQRLPGELILRESVGPAR